MLKSLALKIPQIKALVQQRDALAAERDFLLNAKPVPDPRVDGLLVANKQLTDALAYANALPLPPRHLQERVVGGYFADFLSSANRTLSEFNGALKHVGKTLTDFERVLDLGVGCGRVIRRFHELYPNASLTGADIDAEAIAWLQQNYASLGKFVVLSHLPPSSLEGAHFDLVYVISVFTHLNEQMQFAWLGELSRVTKTGAYLLMTIQGRNHQQKHPADTQKAIAERGLYYIESAPETEGLPAFYKTTIHTREYVEREWSRFFDILHFEEMGAEGHQDLILCRKR
jgi:ubiquinone/menaquinone biosynthesis C-methylase UbiE